jgi:TatA/E family protein of Tat protein translocase
MFGIGTTELVVCMVIGILLFGHRLPGVMRGVGESFKALRDGMHDLTT